MGLLLPAASIGRDMSIGEASQKIQGNSWRLIFIYLLVFAAAVPVGVLIGSYTFWIRYEFRSKQLAGVVLAMATIHTDHCWCLIDSLS